MNRAREIAEQLGVIREYAKLYPSAHGQIIGQETWRIVLSGESLQWITAAADKLIELEQSTAVPVLTVECEPDYWSGGHYHEGTKPYIAPTAVWGLPIGTKLYTAPVATEQVEETSELTRQRDKLLAALTEIAELDILKYHHAYAIAKGAIEELTKVKP